MKRPSIPIFYQAKALRRVRLTDMTPRGRNPRSTKPFSGINQK